MNGVHLSSMRAGRWVAPVLLCLLTAVAATGAQAAMAKASVSGLSFEVLDLDLNDGIDAGYRFEPSSSGWSYTSSTLSAVNDHGYIEEVQIFSPGWFASDASNAISGPHADAAVTYSPGLLQLSSQSLSNGTLVSTWADSVGYGLFLAPHTQITFSVSYEVLLSVDNKCGVAFGFPSCEGAGGWIEVSLGSANPEVWDASDSHASTFEANVMIGVLDLEESSVVSVTVANTLSTEVEAVIYMGSRFDVASFPVPEPASWALSLAGLACVCAAAHHRRWCGKPA